MGWRNSREYRVWRASVIRANGVCAVCGSRQNRHAHHLKSASHYPEFRFDVHNGACLCRAHHIMFHTEYKNNFGEICTEFDFDNFLSLYYKIDLEVTKSIIKNISERMKK